MSTVLQARSENKMYDAEPRMLAEKKQLGFGGDEKRAMQGKLALRGHKIIIPWLPHVQQDFPSYHRDNKLLNNSILVSQITLYY